MVTREGAPESPNEAREILTATEDARDTALSWGLAREAELLVRITELENALRRCEHYIMVSPMPGRPARRDILHLIQTELGPAEPTP